MLPELLNLIQFCQNQIIFLGMILMQFFYNLENQNDLMKTLTTYIFQQRYKLI